MTAFRYRALDREGVEKTGVMEADTSRSARTLLREQGLFPIEVDSVTNRSTGHSGRRMAPAELTLLSRQWSTLLASGLTVEESLAALIEQAESDDSRQVLAGVRSEILSGFSLRAALDRYPRAFPEIYRASVAAGERSGELARVMVQLADYLERAHALRQKTLQALIYPIIVAVVATLVIVGLMAYVVPQVVTVFEQGNQSLPLLTRLLILLSDFVRNWGWVFTGLLAAGIGAAHYVLRTTPARRAWDRSLLRLPFVGRHLRTLDATRFSGTLAILTASGVPLLSALEAGSQVVTRLPLKDALAEAIERVREGQSLSRALGATRAFPPLLIHMIANGESTGRLDALLERAAALQQQEYENRTARLTSLLEPLLLLIMGSLVLLIVMAVMQPIIEINTLLR
ncbi:MAG TPA: type II secretion system inner membrane protein GspF [Azoarcus taiwanensis]|nr:type II secretion system inner membrane protein GspF [Azoarcus taiwanensis]